MDESDIRIVFNKFRSNDEGGPALAYVSIKKGECGELQLLISDGFENIAFGGYGFENMSNESKVEWNEFAEALINAGVVIKGEMGNE